MSITSSSVDSFAALASQIFNRVDSDKDGKVSSNEFQTFLLQMLNKSGTSTADLTSQATAVSSAVSTATAAPKTYQAMAGFDTGKLNDSSHTSAKYVFARATQDVNLGFDRASRSAGLDQIADYVKKNGYPDAKVTGDDTIDFGSDVGNVDVLTGSGSWWWGPKS